MSLEDRQHIIYKSLDNPVRILFWDLEEFLLMAIPFFIGILMGSLVLMCTGFLFKYFYSRFYKKHKNLGFGHLIYWNLPTMKLKKIGIFKSLPESHIREYFR